MQSFFQKNKPKIIYSLIITFLLVLSALIFLKPAVIFLARRHLSKIFSGSEVSIAGCKLKPASLVALSGIEIKKGSAYDFKVAEAGIHYNLASIIQRRIKKFTLKGARVFVKLPQKNSAELAGYLGFTSAPQSAFSIETLELSDLGLGLDLKDLKLECEISADIDLIRQAINNCDLEISSLNVYGFQIQNVSTRLAQGLAPTDFSVQSIKYNKAAITEIKSKARLDGKSLFLDSLSAKFLAGQIGADLRLKIDKGAEYSGKLNFINLSLEDFVNDFNLTEKLKIGGKLGGTLIFAGKGPALEIISGDFSSLEPGGTLVIKDSRLLENTAGNSGQSLDILLESFKDYRYNIGKMKISLNGNNLALGIALDGQQGKRDITIILHDFGLKKEER